MKQRLAALLITLGAFLSFPNTGRASTMFIANLTTSQENPPAVPTLDGVLTPRPTSGGSGTFVLNDAMTELSFSITVTNIDFGRVPSLGTPVVNPPTANPFPQTAGILNDDLLAAHFHRGPVGTNGPVIFGFIGTPFNDNNPNNVVVTPTPGGIGATVTGIWNLGEGNGTTLTAEIPNLLAGLTYVNFHTVQFGGGEIRGQITPVPEPGSLPLLLLGGACAASFCLLRKRALSTRR